MSFKTIIGQDRALGIIEAQLKGGTLKGSYLFSGPSGTGKVLTALNLAKALNCEKGEQDACDACSSCNRIDGLKYPDVFIIEKGEKDSQIKIDYIRSMLQRINLRPFEGKCKVFIIKDAEHLSQEAASALLKILEEPPDDSLIILTSSDFAVIFPTILSRCKKIVFSRLKVQDVENILSEKHGLDKESSRFLANFSEGSLGEAVRLKGLDILSLKNGIIDNFMLGEYVEGSTSVFNNEREDLKFTLGVLAAYLRDLWILKAGEDTRLINADRIKQLQSLKEEYSLKELDAAFKDVSQLAYFNERNLNTKLIFNYLRLRLSKK